MNIVLQLEKGSFVPNVYTTTGGMAPEARRFIRRLDELRALLRPRRNKAR